ncbi:DOMON domain-containing protein [Candidatus Bipolaricaulota bacterium]
MGQRRMRSLIVGIAAAAALSVASYADAMLTLRFEEMDPHVGQLLELRVVNLDSGREIARMSLPEIPSDMFELEIEGLEIGGSIRLDFYTDANGNGVYDAPPADHAWRVELPGVQGDGMLSFAHNTDFTDIEWPPYIDGSIGKSEYRNEMRDSAIGMTVYWQNDAETLFIGLMSPGAGWLSIGFGPERQMEGANIVIAAISDGELVIEDHYGNAPTSHRQDLTDHIIQAAGVEVDGQSVLEFAIPLVSDDSQDVDLTAGESVAIILAYHSSNDSLTARHSQRATTVLQLDN